MSTITKSSGLTHGLLDCRVRRVKCDETRPTCLKCQRAGRQCDGYSKKYFPVDTRAIAEDASRLPVGWWQCEECAREVDPNLWGYVCPDCSFVNEVARSEARPQTQAVLTQSTVPVMPLAIMDRVETDANVDSQPESPHVSSVSILTSHKPSRCCRWRVCHTIICIGILTFIGSLTLAMWWSMAKDDVSGGFTMAAYIVAVGGLPLASIQMRHNQRCRCWKNTRDESESGLDSG